MPSSGCLFFIYRKPKERGLYIPHKSCYCTRHKYITLAKFHNFSKVSYQIKFNDEELNGAFAPIYLHICLSAVLLLLIYELKRHGGDE
jgi:hypothetical protein